MNLRWTDQLVDDALDALERGDGVRALSILDQLAAERPYDVTVRWVRAKILLSLGNYEEALMESRLAVRMDSSSADSHFLLACAAWRLERIDDARESFEAAIRLAIKDVDITQTYARFMAEYGHPRVAESAALRAIQLDGSHAGAWAALAAAKHCLGKQEAAMSDCQHAIQLDPPNAYAQSVLDDIQRRRKR